MKQFKNIIYITILFCMMPFISSCSDDEMVDSNNYNIKEGIPVAVSFNFGVSESKEVSRAASSYENVVQNVFVIAFNSSGSISSYKMEDDQKSDEHGGILYDGQNASRGTITDFYMQSGSGQRIFAIANVGTGYDNLAMATLTNFSGDLDDFLALSTTLNTQNATINRGAFLMTGELLNISGQPSIAVGTDNRFLNVGNSPTIYLNRLEARITFNIKVDRTEHSDLTFTPTYYRVKQYPTGSYLFPHEKTTTEAATENTWDYTAGGRASISDVLFDDPNNSDGSSSFDFYVWENRFTPKKKITSEAATTDAQAENMYALREKRLKDEDGQIDSNKPGQEYVLSDFEYANDNSTYVEIVGTLTYTDGDKTVTASATYTVHLGNTGNSSTNEWYNVEDLVNNYDTERNTHYTYTVTLAGVESMRVEVQEDKEVRPGVEGDVTVTNRTFDIDAHYGRAHFKLTRAAVEAGLSWSFYTPFQRGGKNFDANNYLVNGSVGSESDLSDKTELKTDLNNNDYRWVQFVINAEAIKSDGTAVPSDEFAKYPGQDAYSGGSGSNNPAPAFGGNGYHYSGGYGNTGYYSQNVKMYDVNQLLNHLYVEAKKTVEKDGAISQIFLDADGNPSADGTAEVTITAFVDEFVYIYNPEKVFYKAPGSTEDADDLVLWRRVVNGTNRTLSIAGNGRQYSPDGNTSWMETNITFSQRPIYTFYDNTNENVKTAWGTESIREKADDDTHDGMLLTTMPDGVTERNNNTSNGRDNTVNAIVRNNLRWSDVLHLEAENFGELKDSYNTIWYAVLGRNRDLNGDDIVQADEIRWYLASIDQLTDLWIGEAAIPNARLYDTDKYVSGNEVKAHHVASSSRESDGNVWVIWAEEGASRGGTSESKTYNGDYYDYRCVRNLGISLNNIDEEPEDYVTLGTSSYTNGYWWTGGDTFYEYFIDVSKLDPNTLRTGNANSILGSHTERTTDNYPSRRFAVIREGRYSTYWRANWSEGENSVQSESTGSPCPRGYRIPNQRELLLLTMYFGHNRENMSYNNLFDGNANDIFVCKTNYAYNGSYVRVNSNGSKDAYSGRPGFGYQVHSEDVSRSTFLLLNTPDGTFYVRCVRDVTE